jgi:unsaturated chondroitin disaccharide hydrolase
MKGNSMSDLSEAWDCVIAKAAGMSQMDAFPLWTTGDSWVTASLAEPDRGIMPHDGSWMVGDLPSILWFVASGGDGDATQAERRRVAMRWSERLNNRSKVVSFASVAHMFFRGALVPLERHGAEEIRPMLMTAAKTVSDRFRAIGYMKSFGAPDNHQFPFTTIDDVINLCVPLWYAHQVGDTQLADSVIAATDVIGDRLVRPDGSTIQVLLYNEDGTPGGVDTYQGHSAAGCWSRGLAWGIYGYAIMAGLSGKPEHVELAQRMATYWMNRVQDDPSPVWDFELPSADDQVRDSFAGSLAYAGLIELAAISDPGRAEELTDYVTAQMSNLSRKYVVPHQGPGVLRGAALDVPHDHGVGHDAAVIVGDSYYVEALWRLRRGDTRRPLLAAAGGRQDHAAAS